MGRRAVPTLALRLLAGGEGDPETGVHYNDRLGVIMDAWARLSVSVICFRILHHDAA